MVLPSVIHAWKKAIRFLLFKAGIEPACPLAKASECTMVESILKYFHFIKNTLVFGKTSAFKTHLNAITFDFVMGYPSNFILGRFRKMKKSNKDCFFENR